MKRIVGLVATIIILVFVVIFTLQNAAYITVNFLFWSFESSLALVLFVTFSLGVLASIFTLASFMIKR